MVCLYILIFCVIGGGFVVECVCVLEMALLYCSTYPEELSMRLEDVS